MVDVLDDASNGLDEPAYEIPMYGNSRRPHDDWIHSPLLSFEEEEEEEHVVVSSRPVH
jgi:hypothetical protein